MPCAIAPTSSPLAASTGTASSVLDDTSATALEAADAAMYRRRTQMRQAHRGAARAPVGGVRASSPVRV
ncbi:hypothetical protein HNR00_001571 [Methylorubrum rhodinum]|uniref:Uncharacterized protein n=1 Tax=Methylorubrum rhodinum TaxID=29428 RepID=A0A840ZJ55_9HYPH|nr:hypothetical protein [Methylorubrum rhodinum]MBB5756863.1 hypothetical protein [Methylorubrum rhodinum]